MQRQRPDGRRAAATVGALLLMAVSMHLALGLPDGRLTRPRRARPGAAGPVRPVQPSQARRVTVILAYAWRSRLA